VSQPTDHLDDELLSALVDAELSSDEMAFAQSHLASCTECNERLENFRSVAVLVRRLPELEPPRDFALGPRLVVDPPNVIRLRRWYTATRAAAASLAAVFVLLAAGALYIDSRPGVVPAAELAKPQVLSSAPASQAAPAAAPRAAVPQASPALAPAAGAAAAARPAAPSQPDDQVAATTSVRPLPTLAPTPTVVVPLARVVAAAQPSDAGDPAGPVRLAAIAAGILAALSLLATLLVRHRLSRQV
jgi:anti-sigma factor RsiW